MILCKQSTFILLTKYKSKLLANGTWCKNNEAFRFSIKNFYYSYIFKISLKLINQPKERKRHYFLNMLRKAILTKFLSKENKFGLLTISG